MVVVLELLCLAPVPLSKRTMNSSKLESERESFKKRAVSSGYNLTLAEGHLNQAEEVPKYSENPGSNWLKPQYIIHESMEIMYVPVLQRL